MPANDYGLNAVVYGVPALTGYAVQDFSLSKTPQIAAEVFDADGKRVYVRYDDLTQEGTLNAVFNGATLPVVGETITYDSVEYEVIGLDQVWSNKDCKKITMKLKKSEYLSY